MGGVLRYKWEAYCNTDGRSTDNIFFPQSVGVPKALQYTLEAYCNTNWRCIAILFWEVVVVGVSDILLNFLNASRGAAATKIMSGIIYVKHSMCCCTSMSFFGPDKGRLVRDLPLRYPGPEVDCTGLNCFLRLGLRCPKRKTAILREAKPGGFQTGGFPTFFGKGPDCVADPFGTVPRRCC